MADTQTKEFGHLMGEYVMSVQANGGAVAVQVQHDTDVWITSDTINEDGVSRITFLRAKVRIVPTGGASYRLHT